MRMGKNFFEIVAKLHSQLCAIFFFCSSDSYLVTTTKCYTRMTVRSACTCHQRVPTDTYKKGQKFSLHFTPNFPFQCNHSSARFTGPTFYSFFLAIYIPLMLLSVSKRDRHIKNSSLRRRTFSPMLFHEHDLMIV